MATDLISRKGNAFIVVEEYLMQNFQTVGGVTLTAFETAGFPINSCINIRVVYLAINSTFTSTKTGTIMGSFYRDGANIVRDGGPSVDLVGGLAGNPTVTVNIANQSIVLNVQGAGGGTIVNYRAHITLTIYK